MFTLSVKEDDGIYKVKVDGGKERIVKAASVPESQRFSLKTTIDGVLSNISCVISPETISIFNEVCIFGEIR